VRRSIVQETGGRTMLAVPPSTVADVFAVGASEVSSSTVARA
jgi:hypothetical protein